MLYIMKQIFESYKAQFGKALQGMEVQQDHGIKRYVSIEVRRARVVANSVDRMDKYQQKKTVQDS